MDNSLNLTSEIAYRLKQFYPPILLTIGVPGNILSIFVLLRLRSSQPSIYLVSLACVDLLVLCVCVLLDWIGVLLNIEFTEEYPPANYKRLDIFPLVSCLHGFLFL